MPGGSAGAANMRRSDGVERSLRILVSGNPIVILPRADARGPDPGTVARTQAR